MGRGIVRTFTNYEVKIIDAKTSDVKREFNTGEKVSKKKVSMDYIKETGECGFYVEINETEESREISHDDFMKYSKPVVKKEYTAEEQAKINERAEKARKTKEANKLNKG